MAIERLLFQVKQDLLMKAADATEEGISLSRNGNQAEAKSQVDRAIYLLAQAKTIDKVNGKIQSVLVEAGLQDPPVRCLHQLLQEVPSPTTAEPVTATTSTPTPVHHPNPPRPTPQTERKVSPESKKNSVDPRLNQDELFVLADILRKNEQVLEEMEISLQPQDREDIKRLLEQKGDSKVSAEEELRVRATLREKLNAYIANKQSVFNANSANIDAVTLLALVSKFGSVDDVSKLLDRNGVDTEGTGVKRNPRKRGKSALPALRERVRDLRNIGMGNKEIAQKLKANIGTVNALASQLIASGEIQRQKPKGRPLKK